MKKSDLLVEILDRAKKIAESSGKRVTADIFLVVL